MTIGRQSRRLALGVVAVILAAGCSRRTKPAPGPTERGPKPGIYDVSAGERISHDELVERLDSARFIVLGEQHTSEWQHRRQARLFRALTDRRAEGLALGMEMFQRPYQPALDAYVAEEIDEKTMLERAEWSSRWGVDPSLYRPLWRRARRKGIPIVALNLRRELSREIARVGLQGLPEERREELPRRIDTSIEAQREYVRRAFERHEMSKHMEFEYFLQAQAAWDETMAQSAVEFVDSRTEIDTMVIVAGRAHARSDFGIPARIDRRLGVRRAESTVSVLPVSREESDPAIPRDLEVLRRRRVADYLWIGPRDG